jgi:hypothetical protein
MDFVSVDHMTNFFHGLPSHFEIIIMFVLTNDLGVSYLYVDHKGGEEVCTLAMSGLPDSSVSSFRWIS